MSRLAQAADKANHRAEGAKSSAQKVCGSPRMRPLSIGQTDRLNRNHSADFAQNCGTKQQIPPPFANKPIHTKCNRRQMHEHQAKPEARITQAAQPPPTQTPKPNFDLILSWPKDTKNNATVSSIFLKPLSRVANLFVLRNVLHLQGLEIIQFQRQSAQKIL